MKWLLRFADQTDLLLEKFFKFFSLLAIFLVFAIMLQIVMRYAFNSSNVKLEELQWHLYGVLIMMGVGYCQIKDSHVRVDVLRNNFSEKTKHMIELLGILFIFMPFFVVVFIHGWDYFYFSFTINEASDAPSGLPYRWVIKAFIPLGFFLMFIGVLTRLIRTIHALFFRN